MAGHDEPIARVSGDVRENALRCLAVMLELRHRQWQLLQVALFRFAINAHNPVEVGEGEAAQENVFDQAEDGGVIPIPISRASARRGE